MLEIDAIDAGHGRVQVLRGFSLRVEAGEIVCLLGRNGAGKTTALRAVMGHVAVTAGSIRLEGEELTALPPHEVPRRGVGYVPQGRRLFGELTVAQNLAVGLMARGQGEQTRERVLELFPRLRERLGQRARTLSGGEQQMLAMARALCLRPRLLLMDEPTEGLQPSMIETIRQVALRLRGEGVGILLVEQRIDAVLAVADRVAFIENGRGREVLPAAALRADHTLVARYLGV